MSYKSDETTRLIRTNTKGYDAKPMNGSNLLSCVGLLGKRVKCGVPGEFATVSKMVTIKELYPFHVLCVYKSGIDNEHELKTCLNIADLITLGLIDSRKGYLEVVK